jgi:hypothetical protein
MIGSLEPWVQQTYKGNGDGSNRKVDPKNPFPTHAVRHSPADDWAENCSTGLEGSDESVAKGEKTLGKNMVGYAVAFVNARRSTALKQEMLTW